MTVFIKDLPSWGGLYDEVAADRGIVRTGRHVAHAGSLYKQFFRSGYYVSKTDMTLLDELTVEINLIMEACFYIFRLTINCAKIHVQQIGCTINVECA